MFDRYFDTFLYTKEKIKNNQILNVNELLSQFSQIDFNEIYVNIETITQTDLLFEWEEFYDNIHSSVFFEFFNFLNQFDIEFIYNGYMLKTILFYLFKNFSKKGIPFKTMRKIREWKTKQAEFNASLCDYYINQQIHTIEIDDLTNIYQDLLTIFSQYNYDPALDAYFRLFHHYFQTTLQNRDFLYITKPNEFVIRYSFTKKINRTIYLNVHTLIKMTNMLLTEFKNFLHDNKINDKKSLVVVKKIDSTLRRLDLENPSEYDNYQIDNGEYIGYQEGYDDNQYQQEEYQQDQYYQDEYNYDYNNYEQQEYDQYQQQEEQIQQAKPATIKNVVKKSPAKRYEVDFDYNYEQLDYNNFKQDYHYSRKDEDFYPSLLDTADNRIKKDDKKYGFNDEEYQKFIKGK